MIDETKAGEEVASGEAAGLRCEQVCRFTASLEWEQFQVHSCGVWPADTPSLSACAETLSPWE